MVRDFEPLDVMQDFLLSVVQDVPEELAMHVRSLQSTVITLRHELETLERLETRVDQTRQRLRQELEYLQMRTMSLADTATKASVIEPLARKLRDIVSVDLMGELISDQTNKDDGTIASRDDPDDC